MGRGLARLDEKVRKEVRELFLEEQKKEDEEKRQNTIEAAKVADKKMQVRSSDIQSLIQAPHDDFMNYFYSTVTRGEA